MKKILILFLLSLSVNAIGQKMISRTGEIKFDATVPGSLDVVAASDNTVSALLDKATGDFVVQSMVKSFKFKSPLMQEHFNENYMESEKFPKANFKGIITNLSAINFSKDGDYDAQVAGKLTIHGVTKDTKFAGKINVKGGKVTIKANTSVLLADYNIAIPGAVKDKISKDVKVNVNMQLEEKK